MTINSTNRKAGPYAGTGSQTDYPFAFKVFAASDMLVVRTDTAGNDSTLILGTDYTVTLNADQNANPGGSVRSAAPVGFRITLGSVMPATQGQSIPNNGGFFPKVIEDALDRLTILTQQLAEQVGRAVKTSISSPTSPDQLLASINEAVSDSLAYATSAGVSATASAGSANAAANSAQQSAASADTSAQNVLLSAKWATYLGGPVSGGEYSAKYWAGKAAEAASGDAINIKFTPAGNVFSTNVQAAIQELDTKKANVADLSAAIPVGMRGEFFTNTAPDNWIKANGGAIPVASYAVLAVVLYCGDANNATAAWGYRCTSAATPTTTRSTTGAYIVLPDARGEYSRGWDDGRGIDAGRSLWAWQAGQVLSHTHTASQAAHSHTVNLVGGGSGGALGISYMADLFQGTTPTSAAQPAITVTATGGTENLVRGLAALVCIKYK